MRTNLRRITILTLDLDLDLVVEHLVTPPMGKRSIVMSVSVCVCICVCVCPSVRDHIFGTSRPIFTKIFMHVTYGRGSVHLWWRSDMLCTSGSMNDVIFAHKPRLLDAAAQLKRSAHAALGLAISCAYCAVISVAGQRTHGTTFRAFKVASQVATPWGTGGVCGL